MNEQPTNEQDELKEKVKFYHEREIVIHISLNNDFFYNGKIKEISAEFIIFEDKLSGEMPIFFREIKNVEPYRRRNDL